MKSQVKVKNHLFQDKTLEVFINNSIRKKTSDN